MRYCCRAPPRCFLTAVTLALVAAAAAAAAAPAAGHYTLDPAKSSLQFTFVQAGAQNTGRFRRFTVSFDPPPDGLRRRAPGGRGRRRVAGHRRQRS